MNNLELWNDKFHYDIHSKTSLDDNRAEKKDRDIELSIIKDSTLGKMISKACTFISKRFSSFQIIEFQDVAQKVYKVRKGNLETFVKTYLNETHPD